MRPVEAIWFRMSKFILLPFAIPFTIIGLLTLLFLQNPGWIINGILWGIVGTVLFVKGKLRDKKLARLKSQGIYYNADIVEIIPNKYVRYGSYLTAKVECVYTDANNCTCLVQSDYFLLTILDSKETLNANLYTSQDNHKDYIIELMKKSAKKPEIDYDYR
jgi:hypothetical protein